MKQTAPPPKRMVINIRTKPALPPGFLDAAWDKLLAALHCIRDRRALPPDLSKGELCSLVEDLCMNKQREEMVQRLYAVVDAWTERRIQELRRVRSEALLQSAAEEWRRHIDETRSIRLIFLYLDRSSRQSFQMQQQQQQQQQPPPQLHFSSLWDLSLQIFKRHLVASSDSSSSQGEGGPSNARDANCNESGSHPLLTRLVDAVLEVIERERSTSSHESETYHYEALRMLSQMGLYAQHFEPRFLRETGKFYGSEALGMLSVVAIPEYLAACSRRLGEEHFRASSYLDATTRRPLMKAVETELIASHAEEILTKGFTEMMDSSRDRLPDLERLYALFAQVAMLPPLQKAFHEYVKFRGAMIKNTALGASLPSSSTSAPNSTSPPPVPSSSSANAEEELVPELIALKNRIDRVVRESFRGDEAFVKSEREAFESFLNANEVNRVAELVAKFVDKQMRSIGGVSASGGGVSRGDSSMVSSTTNNTSTNAGGGGGEITEPLERALEVFRFIHAKDVFQEFYKVALAKRLLLGTSASDDLERAMISKLKLEVGAGFTGKLEGMFRDMELSKQLDAEFRHRHHHAGEIANEEEGKTMSIHASSSSSLSPRAGGTVEARFHVLSMGHWPTYPDFPTFRLPPELAVVRDTFQTFYVEKFGNSRKLSWKHSLSHVLLRAQLPSNPSLRYELDVSLFQAAVLLRFNERQEWSMREIGDYLGFPTTTTSGAAAGTTSGTKSASSSDASSSSPDQLELARTITSLALAKREQRILMRTNVGGGDNVTNNSNLAPSGKLVGLNDVFRVDPTWSSKRLRIKINQIQFKETKREADDSHERVQNDRQYQIDAAVVRIMKARKSLSHNNLIAELFKQLSFPAAPALLKKRIESLIDREYLERSAEDSNTYVYLA